LAVPEKGSRACWDRRRQDDVMSMRPHLPQVRVLEVLEDAPARLAVGVEPTLRPLRCPTAG